MRTVQIFLKIWIIHRVLQKHRILYRTYSEDAQLIPRTGVGLAKAYPAMALSFNQHIQLMRTVQIFLKIWIIHCVLQKHRILYRTYSEDAQLIPRTGVGLAKAYPAMALSFNPHIQLMRTVQIFF